jgi:uncharacterized protein YuzE
MAMPIEHFKWTIHAEERLPQRGYDDIDAVRIVSALVQEPAQATVNREVSWTKMIYAYYDPDADIAWLPTGSSESVGSEEVEWGLIDHDAATDEVVAVEIWAASKRLPRAILDALPRPGRPQGVVA